MCCSKESKTKDTDSPISNIEEELCVICFDNVPNILIDPCCHGGICKKCIIDYLKEG